MAICANDTVRSRREVREAAAAVRDRGYLTTPPVVLLLPEGGLISSQEGEVEGALMSMVRLAARLPRREALHERPG